MYFVLVCLEFQFHKGTIKTSFKDLERFVDGISIP